MIIRDLFNTAKNVKYLIFNTLTPSAVSDIQWREEYSELSTILRTRASFLKTIYNITFGQEHQCELLMKEGSDCEHWFFINGITTTKEVASINELALEELFGVEFSTLYNPTNGIIPDLLECIFERTLDNYSDISRTLYDKIDELLLAGKKIKIIAHSQGGIILNSFLKTLKNTGKKFPNVEVYTFASAADEETTVPGLYQEHFCNENDFVSRIGMMINNPVGPLYIKKNSNGHLLNRDYLEHFKEGKYCGGKSRLFKYIKRKK
jgi:hypothetical protein